MSRHRIRGAGSRSRLAVAVATAAATVCALLGWQGRRDDVNPTLALAAVLAEVDQIPCPGDCGCATLPPIQPGHDYLAEALALTPTLVQQMASVTAAELAGLHRPA